MDFFVILISSDSSEESVRTSTARVILFSTIPTTIPPTTHTVDLPVIYDDTQLISIDTPTISPIVPTILLVTPTIQYTSPFICTDSSNSDTPDTPPSKSVRSLPIHRLALRYSADYSSSNHFTSDDSSRDSPPNSSSKASLDSHSDTSSWPSRKRCRSPTSSIHVALPIPRALSLVRADLLLPRKRIRDSDSVTYFKVSSEDGYMPHVPREVGLGVDAEDSYEPYTELDIDPDVLEDIDECFVYADAIGARWTDVRVAVKTTTKEEVESSARGAVKVEVDPRVKLVIDDNVCESVREDVHDHVTADGDVEVTYETLGDLVQRFHDHTMEIPSHRILVIEGVLRF
nr:hypothetical protein [Tanacetum cinerariifolium]